MKQLFIILIALNFNFCFGQIADNTNGRNNRNIYYQALIELYNSEHPDKSAILDTTYLIEDRGITDSILSSYSSGEFIIIVMKKEEILKRTVIDTNFTFLSLFPLEYKNGFFYVPVKRFWIVNNKETQENEYKIIDCLKLQFDFLGKKFVYKRRLVCIN